MKRTSRIPPAPTDLDVNALFANVDWFQRWEVFSGVFTPGHSPIAELCENLGLPDDLTGKRVLDLGAWNGCSSFECERRNALEVVALSPEDPHRCGYDRLRRVLGSTRTRFVRGTVYDLDPAKLGFFDVVLFCGVLYHLRYPLLAIDNIRRVATDKVYVETVVMDQREISNGEKFLQPHLPLWLFFRGAELENDRSNWFGPNQTAVLEAFHSAGFNMEPLGEEGGRGVFRATVRPGLPEFVLDGTLECVYYREVMAPLVSRHRFSVRLDEALDSLPSFLQKPTSKIRAQMRKRWFRNLVWADYVSADWQRKVELSRSRRTPKAEE